MKEIKAIIQPFVLANVMNALRATVVIGGRHEFEVSHPAGVASPFIRCSVYGHGPSATWRPPPRPGKSAVLLHK